METVLMIIVMGAALYFLMIRPQQKRAKEQKELMGALAPGGRVMTVSGIIGTIKYLGEKQAILEVSPGVEMTIDKRAISPQAVEDEFEYADADADAEPDADADVEAVLDTDAPEAAIPEVNTFEPNPPQPEPGAETGTPATSDAPDAEAPTWDNPGTSKN